MSPIIPEIEPDHSDNPSRNQKRVIFHSKILAYAAVFNIVVAMICALDGNEILAATNAALAILLWVADWAQR